MHIGLRVTRRTFGKDCNVSPSFPGSRTTVNVTPGAHRIALRTKRATLLGTPISELARFRAAVRHRPMATQHPVIDPHSHVIREGIPGGRWARRVFTTPAYPPLSQPLHEK